MLGFNEEEFLEQVRSTVALRPQIEELVARIQAGHWKNIYFIGAGGTYAAALPYERFFQTRSDFPVRTVIGKEFVLAPDPQFGPDSVAIFASVSGTTEDILDCVEFAREKGALTIGFTGYPESPIATAVDEVLLSAPKAWPFDVQFLLFGAAFLAARGEFEGYDRLVQDLDYIPEALVAVTTQADAVGQAFAQKHAETDYHFLVGSGNLWGFTYLYSMCILEEMQWLRTTRVHAAEFFHGSLELIEKDTSLLLFVGEDETRPLMDRVHSFATTYSDDVTVIDTKDYALPGVSDEFRGLLSPMVADAVVDRFSKHLAQARDHSLDLRRYYRVVEY
ncbi:SIS domain-containing protein [Leifsonia naganoensis]|uniref:Fructoselysine-6-phosphate deglycase n=1 Tax=Leifsonia naganoensis TaxID=150025 RepID=A0A853DQ05_9MICO|nr:SIS domain-containing protein [Leifsonia naganoensis]NYK10608.1 fructoselysine-6-phosphate deglycase [Leifsonia naganoensis]